MLYLILHYQQENDKNTPKGMIIWSNLNLNNYVQFSLHTSPNRGVRLLSGKRGQFIPEIGQYVKWNLSHNNILIG